MSKKQPASGFTIVEIMLVLAIAGLILMMILLAIPALTRNSRNNQRKQDVQTILEAVSRYQLNNSGNMPDNSSNFLQYAKLSGYETSSVNVYPQAASGAAATESNNDLDKVDLYNYRKCSTTTAGSSTNRGAGYGDVVALYAVETSNATAPQCQQL